MIEPIEVKAACNGILKKLFPELKIYGSDTTGALERPSFYTEISSYLLTYETTNLCKQRLSYKISVMEEVTDEVFDLRVFSAVRKAFGLKLKIGDRQLSVVEPTIDYTGSKNDVFQITITLEWYDTIAEEDQHDLMMDVTYRYKVNGG